MAMAAVRRRHLREQPLQPGGAGLLRPPRSGMVAQGPMVTTSRFDRAVITIRPASSGDAALLVECEACHLGERVALPISALALRRILAGWSSDHLSRCPASPHADHTIQLEEQADG